jgi:hypothetical protein
MSKNLKEVQEIKLSIILTKSRPLAEGDPLFFMTWLGIT